MSTEQVIAKHWTNGGQVCSELVSLGRGPRSYIVARDGQIRDARRRLTAAEAREWYDTAAIRIGPRPGKEAA